MKVLLTGASGQLGNALQAILPGNVELIAGTRAELDLADAEGCRRTVLESRPDWVLNAGAYTAVDKAESESELAYAINAGAPSAFAEALADYGGQLLQLSTDFVFDGYQGKPYKVDQVVNPLSVYGSSKAAGEKAALKFKGTRVLRTSWVYGPVGHNFCLTMLRLHAEKASAGEALGVVADQVGCPTSTHTLAVACWRLITMGSDLNNHRLFHWTDAGAATWYDFAFAIGELAVQFGLIENAADLRPITTDKYPTPAERPSYSLLDCSTTSQLLQLEAVPWRRSLAHVLSKLQTDALLD